MALAHIPRSNAGLDTHVPSTRRDTSQRVDITRYTLWRPACSGWGTGLTTLRTATPALVHSAEKYWDPVGGSSACPPHWPCRQRRLADCDRMPASYTSGQASYPRRHPTCCASLQRSHTVSSAPCHGAWTSAPLSAHLTIKCECTPSQIETPICSLPAAK